MNIELNIKIRNQQLIDEVLNQPGAEGTIMEQFNGFPSPLISYSY